MAGLGIAKAFWTPSRAGGSKKITRQDKNLPGDFTLLFVLVDFLKILVGVHLQFAAGSLIAGYDAIGMHL